MGDFKFDCCKLSDSNYSTWELKIRVLIAKEGLLKFIEAEQEDMNADDAKLDAKVQAMLLFSLEDLQLHHIKDQKTAYGIWKALREHHQKSSLYTKVILLKKVCRTVFRDGQNMYEHINVLNDMFEKLANIGEPLSDNLIVAFLLSSLPESYDSVVMSLETRAEENLNSRIVKERLLQEYERRQNKNFEIEEKAFKIEKSGKRCYHCDRPGHVKSECFYLRNNKIGPISKGNKNNFNPGKHQSNKNNNQVKKVESADSEVLFCTAMGQHNQWFIDSGATSHICSEENFFDTINTNFQEHIILADGSSLKSSGRGNGYLNCVNNIGFVTKILVTDVLYVPEMEGNLLSVKKLAKRGLTISFEDKFCSIKNKSCEIACGYLDGKLYRLKTNEERALKMNQGMKIETTDIITWHKRLGHRNCETIRSMIKNDVISDIGISNNKITGKCEVCVKSKMVKKLFKAKLEITSSNCLDVIHSDLCGPTKNFTPSGGRYFLTFVDDFSRFCRVFILKNKGEVLEKFIEFANEVENLFSRKIKTLRTDNGGEYVSKEFEKFLKTRGITHQFTVPYNPEQNGVAERKNRTLQEMVCCLLMEANLDKKFWGEALMTATYLQNRMETSLIKNKTPFELWYGKKPRLKHIRTFGCKACLYIPKEKREKFGPRAEVFRFIGYSEKNKGYRLLGKDDKVIIGRDVTFFEDSYDMHDNKNKKVLNKPETFTVEFSENSNIREENVTANNENHFEFEGEIFSDENVPLNNENFNGENVNGEHVNGENFHNENFFEHVSLPNVFQTETPIRLKDENEPKNFEDLSERDDKNAWHEAMNDEIKCLEEMNAWTLVDNKNQRLIDTKWVYKLKINPINNNKIYRARLVARGFNQKYGIDYDEVFAPVAKPTTLRLLLTISGIQKHIVKHIDIKMAFLNGVLNENIYMKHPKGFENEKFANKVCKLNKSLYGLKQSAKCWNEVIDKFLQEQGFRKGNADECFYTRKLNQDIVYILIYVDDFIISCKNEFFINEIIETMKTRFKINNLGNISYYLGIEIRKGDSGIFQLSQENYINKILKRFDMEEAKESKIPIDTGYFKILNNNPLENNSTYRQAIGSLLYLATHSRPDIATSVSILSRKLEYPNKNDWNEVKRVLRYLKWTKNEVLKLGNTVSSDAIVAYSDADWAGDTSDRKSTSGFLIQYYDSPISWKCQKQMTVSLSSTEAEYVALTETAKEVIWIKHLIDDAQISVRSIVIFEDNQSTLKMLETGHQTRAKHIDVKYHFIKNLKEKGDIVFKYCSTNEMIADMLTKPLSADKLQKFKNMLGLIKV